ncbi:MAG: bifunctional folylpolyglutamate synthase/dihydrofolate synthase [Actinobacteria bacterium]|nr:bifunctional folylpolyglutamate synthase/dihydrofolate synthase [Actinomycetota bacterium]
MDLGEALAWLAQHVNLEADPAPAAAARRLDRIARLVGLMGDPQTAYPVIHLTGTNGKGSTARMVTALLVARGLSVGTYTSPHLERLNERLAWGGEPIADDALAETLSAMVHLEPMLESRPTHFEVLTAAAFRWFADIAVDVAVVEVGLGGRWDATNVADGQVAVVTNVSLDHAETIGPGLEDIAREKAGIVKPGATLVLGETDPQLASIFREASVAAGDVWERDRHFGCTSNRLAIGGRSVELRTPGARYPELFVPAHGAFQGDNAAVAVAAVEAFFGTAVEQEPVSAGLAAVRLPGRLEVVGRNPLCILDGAHNPAGARAAAAAIDEAFAGLEGRVLVVGMLRGRDPVEMLESMQAQAARLVIACPPPSPRALPAEEVAAAAERLGCASQIADGVSEAVDLALAAAGPAEMVLVTGSLYLVGAARAWLHPDSPS